MAGGGGNLRDIASDPAGAFRRATGGFTNQQGPDVTQFDTLSPEQQELLRQQIASLPGRDFFVQGLAEQGGPFSRQGLSESAQRSQQRGQSLGAESSFRRGQASSDLAGARGAIGQALQRTGRGQREEEFEQLVAEPLTEQAQERTRSISRGKSGSFFGSDRSQLDADNRENFVDALARERARFELQGRQQDINTQLQAGQQLSSIAGQRGQLAGQAGQQSIAQSQLGQQAQQFGVGAISAEAARQQQANIQRQQLINQLIGIQTKDAAVTPGAPTFEQQLLGVLGPAAGAAAGRAAAGRAAAGRAAAG